ncbi:MAG: putative sulfate/molybdate transporter [Candidatus Lokiarchaeota archaeon]|nr:putative sulfate/molybdate transporter [Candidatus Lokiarchaeota archaeon]
MKIKKSKRTIKKEKQPTRSSNPTKFSLNEFAGALGDWGTLIPFIIGYISIVGLNPAGIFLCLGLTNIVLGIRFNLPLPVQPQKTIGTIAISQAWKPGLVLSTGFGTGIIWTILGLTKLLEKIVRKVPVVMVRGIQLGLGLILGWTAFQLLISDIFLGVISVFIIMLIFRFKRIPSSIILVALGVFLLFLNESITISNIQFGLPQFDFYLPQWDKLLFGMVIAGIAQLLLTLTNVMIATVSLIKDLFPEKENAITASELAFNMGIMNLISPFLGGIPLCHGSGGLAAQYAFGARTGGSMILEGLMEILLGLFFSETLFLLFINFPNAILGAMLLYTAFLLGKISFKNFQSKNLPIILISAVFCFIYNITLGFFVGLLSFIILKIIERVRSNQPE